VGGKEDTELLLTGWTPPCPIVAPKSRESECTHVRVVSSIDGEINMRTKRNKMYSWVQDVSDCS
jgi:hypothetical protein